MTVENWLDRVSQVLINEGFSDPGPLQQIVKQGQVFGLVKRLNEVWEMHVRGFNNGNLTAD